MKEASFNNALASQCDSLRRELEAKAKVDLHNALAAQARQVSQEAQQAQQEILRTVGAANRELEFEREKTGVGQFLNFCHILI